MHLNIHPIHSLPEFQALDGLYQECFGSASVPTNILAAWWSVFPGGLWGWYDDSDVVGGLSFWPLKEEAYGRFLTGQLREKEFTPQDFELQNPQHFYLSEIALRQDYRGFGVSHHMMMHYFTQVGHLTRRRPLTHLALGYSVEGRRVLEKYGYELLHPAELMPDRQGLYGKRSR